MKQFIQLCLLAVSIMNTANAVAQRASITQDAQGNYHSVKKAKDSTQLKWSGHTYTDTKGETYQVYVSPRANKLYVIKTSKKSGKQYNYYLPTTDKP